MKKIRLLTLLGLVIIGGTLAGCGNNNGDLIIEDTTSQTDAAIKYNDNLVDAASKCIASENIIRDTYDDQNSSIEDIKTAIRNTIKECTTAKKDIDSLGNWEGDDSLKNGILNIVEKYITYYTKFSEVLPYLEQEEVTEEENGKYESLLAEIATLDNELNSANEELISIQEEFAKNHGFELESNDEDSLESLEEVTENEIENVEEVTDEEEVEDAIENDVEEPTENEVEEPTEDEAE